jgi:hypothetical protein
MIQPAGTMSSAAGPLAATTTSGAAGAALVVVVVYLAIVVVSIIAAVRIVSKAGYSGWWVLITIVPIVNFVMLLVFAFSEWPVLREVKMLRAQASSWPGYGNPPGYDLRGGPGGSPWTPGGLPSSGGGAASATPSLTDAPLPPFSAVVPGAAAGGAPANDEPASAPSGVVEQGAEQDSADQAGQEQAASAPPGWYPTPDGRLRYWDGSAWTDHFA